MLDPPTDDRATYEGVGVSIATGEEAVERIRDIVASTRRPEVLGAIGGFGGCFAFEPGRYDRPVLVASTDGVGTKALVAAAAGRYDTIGIDLVAMCADDVVCTGAEPLFLLDYVATGKLDTDQMAQLVGGVAAGCRMAGCALLGGEMAEHPGSTSEGAFDLAGFVVGVVERSAMLGSARVVPGDVLVGLASPGLRCNGYSLARHVLLERGGRTLDDHAWEGATHTVADELLRPSVVYAPRVLRVVRAAPQGRPLLHAAAHVTGGGIAGNLTRVLPPSCDAVVDRHAWHEPQVFSEIRQVGNVDDTEMARVFNLGVGMVLVVAAAGLDTALELLDAPDDPDADSRYPMVIGTVVEGTGRVRMEGA